MALTQNSEGGESALVDHGQVDLNEVPQVGWPLEGRSWRSRGRFERARSCAKLLSCSERLFGLGPESGRNLLT